MLNDFIAQARDNQSVKVSIKAKELKPGSGRGNLSSRVGVRWPALAEHRLVHTRPAAALALRGVRRIL